MTSTARARTASRLGAVVVLACMLSLCPVDTHAADIMFMNVYTDTKTDVYFEYGSEVTRVLKYGDRVSVQVEEGVQNIPIKVQKPAPLSKGASPSPLPPTTLATSTLTLVRPEQGGNAVFAHQARQGNKNIWAVKVVQGTTSLGAGKMRIIAVNFGPSKPARFKLGGVSYTGTLATRGGSQVVDTPLEIKGSKKFEFVDANNNQALASTTTSIDSASAQGSAVMIVLYGAGSRTYKYQLYVQATGGGGGGGAPVGAIVGGIAGAGLVAAAAVVGAVVLRKKKGTGGGSGGGKSKVTLPARSGGGGGGGGGLVGATATGPPPPIPAREGAGSGSSPPVVPARDTAPAAPPPVPARDAAGGAPPPPPVIPPRI